MDTLLSALTTAQRLLDQAGIRNAVIGGIAVGVWGRPRVTDDVDLKVGARRSDLPALLAAVSPDFQPSPGALELAHQIGVLFLDSSQGVRLDLLLAEMGFDTQALERAVRAEIQPGIEARLCTAEDLVIYKLITSRPRDVEDARYVVREQGKGLDRSYVENCLRDFEAALDDSTLLETFRGLS